MIQLGWYGDSDAKHFKAVILFNFDLRRRMPFLLLLEEASIKTASLPLRSTSKIILIVHASCSLSHSLLSQMLACRDTSSRCHTVDDEMRHPSSKYKQTSQTQGPTSAPSHAFPPRPPVSTLTATAPERPEMVEDWSQTKTFYQAGQESW